MNLETRALDLRYTFRTLRRDAAFSAFVILIAAFGIGASATVFSVVNTLLLRPLPFAQPEQLVWIANRETGGLSGQTLQVGHVLDLRERTQTLSAVAGYFAFYGVGDNLLGSGGEPERVSGVPVTDNFFQVLGVEPLLGRFFTQEEARWQGPRAVVLGHGLWQRRFAANPAVVGSSLTINDQPYTIVGVLPASFDFASVFAPGAHFDLFFPFPLTPETNRWGNTTALVGRLKPGVTVEQARAEIKTIATQLSAEYTNRNSFVGFVAALGDRVTGNMRQAVWVLALAVGMVMLIVCANLSNLLLARTATRQRELAIRSALGAGRGRLIALMLTEGLVLSGTGAVLGAALAIAATRALTRLDAVSVPLLRSVSMDGTALAFTALLALAAGLLFGLAPAFQLKGTGIEHALRDATRGSTEGRRGRLVRSALVVSEIAFACMLLVGAGLLIRSLVRLLDVDMGFDSRSAITVRVDPDSRYTTPEQRNAYLDDVLRRVRELPGVQAAGITDALPLGRNRTWGARVKGVVYERGRIPISYVRMITDGYAAAMGIPVRAGRDLAPADNDRGEPVILINETMAQHLFPNEDPIGKVILNACAPERRIVGVVGDVRHLALEQASGNEMYIPMRQCPDRPSHDLVVRSLLPPGAVDAAVLGALRPLAPTLTTRDFRAVQQIVDKSVSPRRFTVILLGGFAAFALVLASLGIYALISYSVNQRVQDIGIRMALGASAAHVQRQIVGHTLLLTAIGTVGGGAASAILARRLEGMLFETTPSDPGTFLVMLLVLAIVAMMAGYLPARRASRIDPMVALRAE
jgi:predicted permease